MTSAENREQFHQESLRQVVNDLGDHQIDLNQQAGDGLPFVRPLSTMVHALKLKTEAIIETGNLPIMMGGEHSLSAGPVKAMFERYGSELAVLWIDAHADINTPGTSGTLNVHGMPIALLCGLESGLDGKVNEDWTFLRESIGAGSMSVSQFAWFGLRDVDPGEKPRVKAGLPITMHDIDRDGLQACWQSVHAWLEKTGAKYLYISFDVDVMDPILAPGTGTAVRGGLTYREAHLLAELIHQSLVGAPYQLVGLDVVEVSPIHDTNNQTATVAVEWVASLFGKSIL
jgi:arginase